MSKAGISIKIISAGEEHIISTFPNEYRSLMALIDDRVYPDGFGECGGMGRCATCQIKLENTAELPAGMGRNELSTLSKLGISDPSTRLSCQVFVDEALHNSTVTVLE